MKPLLKWVGGKTQLLPELLKHVPATFNRYFEPFFGGGALFWHLADTRSIFNTRPFLSDCNAHLVNFYNQLGSTPMGLEEALTHLDQSRKDQSDTQLFNRCRLLFNDALRSGDCLGLEQATCFYVINRLGFNGLWRVNKQGFCNVPPGKFKTPPSLVIKDLGSAAKFLRASTVVRISFTGIVPQAGDFVYCDPPYVPATRTSSFTSYTEDGFNAAAQTTLRNFAKAWAAAGVHVVLSNSDTPFVRALYQNDFDLHGVQARRNVNCKGAKRGKVGELIIVGRKP